MTIDLDVSTDEIERIIGFLGYGRSADSVWFIGIEEGLGNMDSDDAVNNLKARATFDNVMDLYRAHLQLRERGAPIDFERKIPSTQVWKLMAKIMLAREGHENWADKGEANEYIRIRLGRFGGDTFMTELSPIPAGHGADKRWIQMFEKKDPDLADKLRKRKQKLKQLLKDSTPRLVICYGHRMAGEFADVLGITWVRRSEQVFTSANQKCLLLPFFGQGHMNRFVIGNLLRANLLI